MPDPVTRVFAEADVKIWIEDEDGLPVGIDPLFPDDPLFTYCWAEGISISVLQIAQRRAVTGRGRRKIISRSGVFDEIQIDVKHLYVKKTQEFNIEDIFNPFKILQIWFDFNDVTLLDEEKHIWQFGTVTAPAFQLTGQGAESIECTATFLAERLIEQEEE